MKTRSDIDRVFYELLKHFAGLVRTNICVSIFNIAIFILAKVKIKEVCKILPGKTLHYNSS